MRMEWRKAVVQYIESEARPVDKFGHQPRLYALACTIGQGIDYDDDVVFASAWLHDIGVFVGHRPDGPEALIHWDHVPYTIRKVRSLLPAWGFPPAKLHAVEEVIRTHQPQDDPVCIEAVVLRDADILEQLGAIGFLRAAAKIGRDTRYPTFTSLLSVIRSAIELLPGKLRLNTSRELAGTRIAASRSLMAAIEAEAGNLLY